MPQSHVAANLLHQEEEERDTNQQVQNKQMHEKHIDQFSVPQAKDWKTKRQNTRQDLI